MSTYARPDKGTDIPQRELVTLLRYVETGSYKTAAHKLGIAQSTAKQRVSRIIARTGSETAAQAAWRLRDRLEKLA